MNTENEYIEELTKEKRLWDIYKVSLRIPTSKFNWLTTVAVFLVLSLNMLMTNQSIHDTIEIVRKAADTGLATSLSTLGFLVTGFTIFATISQPSLLLAMAKIHHKDSGLSYLKHNYFVIIRVFIYYIAFTVFCLAITILGHKGGFGSLAISYLPHSSCLLIIATKAAYVLLFTGYYFIIIQLKSFIFNIYHAVMTSLRWEALGKSAPKSDSQ